jgi:hypothetical protein
MDNSLESSQNPDYMDERGKIVAKLVKALYGCVQSAKRWYAKLRAVLEGGQPIRPLCLQQDAQREAAQGLLLRR